MMELSELEQATAQSEARERARRQHEDDETLRRLMGHRNGRAWVHRFLTETCHVFETAFKGEEPDRATFFRLGEEYVGKQLQVRLMEVAPELWTLMLAEAKQDEGRLADLPAQEQRKREAEEDIGVRMQGFDLPRPGGVPPSGAVK